MTKVTKKDKKSLHEAHVSITKNKAKLKAKGFCDQYINIILDGLYEFFKSFKNK